MMVVVLVIMAVVYVMTVNILVIMAVIFVTENYAFCYSVSWKLKVYSYRGRGRSECSCGPLGRWSVIGWGRPTSMMSQTWMSSLTRRWTGSCRNTR